MIVLQIFQKVDGYHIILLYLLQYLHWMGIAILAKEGTPDKDHTFTFPVVPWDIAPPVASYALYISQY